MTKTRGQHFKKKFSTVSSKDEKGQFCDWETTARPGGSGKRWEIFEQRKELVNPVGKEKVGGAQAEEGPHHDAGCLLPDSQQPSGPALWRGFIL